MYLLMADTNVGYLWNAETNGALVLGTGGEERARITPAGKFGIGTNAPSHQLEVVGPASVTVGVSAGGSGFAELELVGQAGKNYITSDDTLSFDIGGTERATIATTGLNITSGTLSQGGTAVSLSGHSHSAASTSASGVVQLSDSVSTTDSTLAATATAVKAAYDLTNTGLASYLFGTTSVSNGEIPNAPHFVFSASVTTLSGQVYWTRIVPYRTITVSNLAFGNNTASSGLTTARFGIYTRSGGTFTLQARTASDTTIFNSGSSKVTRALNTTGGYPATYTMTAGTEYWLAVIQVGTTIAPLIYNNLVSYSSGIFGIRSYTLASQSDLPASTTGASSATALYYGAVS